MGRTVLLRRPQIHGNVTRLVRATVLSETADSLRVIPEGQNKPITIKASEVTDAPKVFSTLLSAQRGVIVQRCLPDSPSSLCRILEGR